MFAIGIEFLTGTAVMTAAASREEAEWPPHPARVFMALAAAHYETKPLPEDGEASTTAWFRERTALEWLEAQPAPALSFGNAVRRKVVKFYVPVNDASVPGKPEAVKPAEMRGALGVMPAFRSRQERTFPAVHVGLDAPERFVYLVYPEAPPESVRSSLTKMVQEVIRVGHSSSLVRMWLADAETVPAPRLVPRPANRRLPPSGSLRGCAKGFLAELDSLYNADEIEAFFALADEVADSKGKAKDKAKEAFQERFGEAWTRSMAPPVRRRPSPGLAHNYYMHSDLSKPAARGVFDSEILVLAKQDGPVMGLESTNLIMEALRGTLLTGSEGLPEWFTGHRAPGEPATTPHLALIPLPYVGAEHADGHLLGVALVFPSHVSTAERATRLSNILYDKEKGGAERELCLKLGGAGIWTLRREERAVPPLALRSETWSDPSTVWASVTPIVLDRHPKHDGTSANGTERQAWRAEVAALISDSCERCGFPRPVMVDVDKTSWHRGAPRAKPGPGGMPWFATKPGAPPRQQVHAVLKFDCEVEGPVLLGAGRFRGYGLCKPLGLPGK